MYNVHVHCTFALFKANEYPWMAIFANSGGLDQGGCGATLVLLCFENPLIIWPLVLFKHSKSPPTISSWKCFQDCWQLGHHCSSLFLHRRFRWPDNSINWPQNNHISFFDHNLHHFYQQKSWHIIKRKNRCSDNYLYWSYPGAWRPWQDCLW